MKQRPPPLPKKMTIERDTTLAPNIAAVVWERENDDCLERKRIFKKKGNWVTKL